MLKAHKFHVKFTVHTIMSEGGDVTMEEDYTLSYRTEEWEPESPNNLKFSKTHIQGATGIIAKDLGVHRSQIRITDIYKVHNSCQKLMLPFTVRFRVIGNKLSVQVFGVRGSKGHNGNVTELRKRVAGYQ